MALYVDISTITIPKGFFDDLNVPKLLAWLKAQPIADVAPKSEVDKWVDRCQEWYSVAELKSQRIVELEKELAQAKTEVAKLFAEIGKILYKYDKVAERDKSEYGELIVGDIGFAISELKKKYVPD
jgi:hypothetical protein